MEPHGDELGWIEAALGGDHEAYARLVETYQRPVYALARGLLSDTQEAEDASQEVFLRAYQKLASFDRQRKFSTWLLSIAHNYCIDELRKRRKQRDQPIEEMEFAIESSTPGPEQSAITAEQRIAIARTIQGLPLNYRLVAVLRFYHDLSYDEIEAITGLTEATVKTRLHRARDMIKAELTKQGAVPWSVEKPGVSSPS